jgi:hypothetical protein
MKLFRGKPAEVRRDEHAAAMPHRLTKNLARAENLARMLAESRAAGAVDVADLLAGMYLYEWERLSKFWDDQSEIERFLQQICRISPQRWHYWMEFYDRQRREDDQPKRWRPLGRVKQKPGRGKPLARSAELESVLEKAGTIAPFHDTVEGRTIPILTCECVLLAIVKCTDSETGQRLAASGLDLANLNRAARNPKHAPLD